MTERHPHHHAVYVISVFAELAGVHPQTLRNYERNGLLSPQRTSGGSRRFSDADLAAIRRIQDLTNDGVNLEGVKRIMKLDRLRLRGLSGAKDEFLMAATAQNLRRMAKWLAPITTKEELAPA